MVFFTTKSHVFYSMFFHQHVIGVVVVALIVRFGYALVKKKEMSWFPHFLIGMLAAQFIDLDHWNGTGTGVIDMFNCEVYDGKYCEPLSRGIFHNPGLAVVFSFLVFVFAVTTRRNSSPLLLGGSIGWILHLVLDSIIRPI